MVEQQPINIAPVKLGFRQSMIARFRNYFLAGILVTAPIGITFFVAWSIIRTVDRAVTSAIPRRVQSEHLPSL